MSRVAETQVLADFDVGPADLLATAQLLLSRKPQLAKLTERKNYEVPGLRVHGFSIYEDAERALSRINSIAGSLLKQAVAMKHDDVTALNLLAALYRERGEHESALACDRSAIAGCPDHHESKMSLVKSFLALGRFDAALDALVEAKGVSRDSLECIRLAPFREWAERVAGRLGAVGRSEPFPHPITGIVDGKTILIDHVVEQTPLYVVEAQDLTVIDGFIPTRGADGHVFEFGLDVLQHRSEAAWNNAFIHRKNAKARVIEEPCLYLSGVEWHYQNYYHALAQNFPRLALLLDLPEYAGLRIAVPACIRPWGVDFLKEMGVPEDRLELLRNREDVVFRRVVVPVMRRVAGKDEIQGLRRRLNVNSRLRGTRRFFVGRRTLPSHGRLLVNELEIAAIAAEFGFEEVEPGSMSIQQQVELFGQAAAICGPNGAAFGNVIFAPENTAVICMSPRETTGTWYPDLAGLCGQSFYWCFGNFLPEGSNSRLVPKVPYFINSGDFRKLLEIAVGADT